MSTLTKEQIDEMVAGRTAVTEFLDTLEAHGDRTALRWMTGADCVGLHDLRPDGRQGGARRGRAA